MSEILRFSVNIPAEVALRYGEGKRVQGRYGEQVMYTLADGRVMYVPVCVADRIGELEIRPGQPFEICKAEVRDGNRKWIEWLVRTLPESSQPISTATALSCEPQNGHTGGTSSVPRTLRLESRSDRVVDIKTASRRPSCVPFDYAFQLATYRQITPSASGEARLDTLVKTQAVQLVQQSYVVGDADLRATQVLYPSIQESIRTGLYLPNRDSLMCSRRHCAFWQHCQNEYGGSVPS